jgi:raffinose/stachyose/melibiose transport system substrate-binding protein
MSTMGGTKKMLCVMLSLVLIFITGCSGGGNATDKAPGSDAAAQKHAQPEIKIKFFTKGNENQPNYRVLTSLFEDYKREVNPNLKVEIESIPNHSQYFQKLRTYIAGNQIPDFYNLYNGILSEELAKQGKLVDMKALLQEYGVFKDYNKAAIDFLSHEDKSLYLYPSGSYSEPFWYYTEPFKKHNIKVPTTFDEFIEAADILKKNGYTPIAVAGKEIWQLIRYLSFMPLRLTHDKFVQSLKVGKISMGSEIGMMSANFLHTLGTKGYFQKGFSGMDYTQTLKYFSAGNAVILYAGTNEIENLAEKYDKGIINYFLLPDVAGKDNIGPKVSIHAGLAYALNAETFDDAKKDVFKYVIERYPQRAYEQGFIPPVDGEVPGFMPSYVKALAKEMKSITLGHVSWDDKLDPATTEFMGAAANELALGLITPEEFAKKIDAAIAENAPKFFGNVGAK